MKPKISEQSLHAYCRTDMASELFAAHRKDSDTETCTIEERGIRYCSYSEGGIEVEKLCVENKEGEALLQKSIGTYYTVHTGKLRLLSSRDYQSCVSALRHTLSDAITVLLGDTFSIPQEDGTLRGRRCSIFTVGLGNPELTPDAIGPACVNALNVTRHLEEDAAFAGAFLDSVHMHAAFCPMVVGQTGIETLELVRGAVQTVQPDLVILVDALAASEMRSLCRTVQISTTGIHPGGGIGNKRSPLDRETLGVPVLTVGVPTVISAATLIYRGLEASDLLPQMQDDTNPLTARLIDVLKDSDMGFVSPKDIDCDVKEFARLIAQVLNEIVLGVSVAGEWFCRV